MGKIRIMEEGLANKIAAGEVVERPASVVKELVENALDAGAKKIEIEIGEGGLSLIRVSDDGEGMAKEDLPLAFTRHATSKMLQERDLFHIRTLGFRGEALPSIAAVSKVTVASRQAANQLADLILIEGGLVKEEGEMPHPIGTTLWVKELFFNTPARLKYMKSVTTENYHIQDILTRLSLAHPDSAIHLINDGREVFRTPGTGELLHAVHALYGVDVAKSLIPVKADHPDFSLSGVIGKPEWTRGSKQYLTFIINGRVIRSLMLQRALLAGYETLLPLNRYPFAVLSLRMDASLVDVNVHPAKWEARFSKEEELSRWLTMRIKENLLHQRLIPNASLPRTAVSYPEGSHFSDGMPEEKRGGYESGKVKQWEAKEKGGSPWRKENPSPLQGYPDLYHIGDQVDLLTQKGKRAEGGTGQNEGQTGLHSGAPDEGMSIAPHGDEERSLAAPSARSIEEAREIPRAREANGASNPPFGQLSLFRGLLLEPLAQLHDTYIVAQGEDGLYLIDQHAAQERINYEKIRKRWIRTEDQKRQILMVPYTYEVAAGEVEYVKQALPMMEELGIIQEPFGERAFLVREVPLWFDPGEEVRMLQGIIQLILEGRGSLSPADLKDAALKQMACKASIKANQSLNKEEMRLLIEELSKAENPYTCPHGRPILIHFTKYDLEKMFKRVM